MTPATATKEITRLNDLREGRRDLPMIDPRIIVIEKNFNPRDYRLPENRAHIDFLKNSIKTNGFYPDKPLSVRFDRDERLPVLVDGECRLRAVLELIKEGEPIKSVPCVQVQGNDEAERLVIAITSNTGKALSKWEAGAAYVRLQKYGWEIPDIARRCAVSTRYVTEAIELTDAPQDVKQLMSTGAVSPALALDEIRKSGSKAATVLKERVEQVRAKRGEKAVASRPRVTKQQKDENTLLKLVKSVLKDVEEKTLTDSEFDWVEVKRTKLNTLAKYVESL